MLIKPIMAAMAALGLTGSAEVAVFHLGLNLVLAVLTLPLLTPLAHLLERLLPDRPDPADPREPLYLDRAARETPIVAIGGARARLFA